MELELHPAVVLQPGTWSVLIAPEEVVVPALNDRLPTIGRFLTLYICGNYSRLLSRLHHRTAYFEIRRSFTSFQLLRILEEAHHTFIFVEYDRTLFDEDSGLTEYLPRALHDASQQAAILVYAPSADRVVTDLARSADRVFHISLPVTSPLRKPNAFTGRGTLPTNQSTLEVF